jgi:AcrR family transcriptional regulator
VPPAKKPKRQRRPDERPEELALSALRLFTERGYYSTTIDDIAEAAGVTKGAVYHHFDSKEELLIAAVENFFNSAIQRMKTLLQDRGSMTPEQRCRTILSAGSRVWCLPEFTAIFTIVFGEAGGKIERLRETFLNCGPRRAWPVLKKAIRDGQKERIFRHDVDVDTFVPSMTSAIALQCMFLRSTGATAAAMNNLVEQNVETYLRLLKRLAPR